MDVISKQQAWAELRHSLSLLAALGRSWGLLFQLTWRWLVWMGLTAVSIFTVLATLTTYLPLFTPSNRFLRGINWLVDLATHFQPQYFLILLIISGFFLLQGRFKQAGITAVFCLINLSLIAPLYFPAQPAPTQAQTYRVLSLNVYAKNNRYEDTLALIAETQPDIIILIDSLEGWRNAMLPLLAEYPYTNHYHSSDYHGTIIYSRLPFANKAGVQPVAKNHRPAALTQIDVGGQAVTLLAAHPRSPRRIGRLEQRNAQLLALEELIASVQGPRMVIGDLNTTPWSPIFRRFIANSGLRNGRQGFGLQATWPTTLGAWGIPIDHMLVSPEIAIHQLQHGPDVGSDHYPIIVDFSVAPASTVAH